MMFFIMSCLNNINNIDTIWKSLTLNLFIANVISNFIANNVMVRFIMQASASQLVHRVSYTFQMFCYLVTLCVVFMFRYQMILSRPISEFQNTGFPIHVHQNFLPLCTLGMAVVLTEETHKQV